MLEEREVRAWIEGELGHENALLEAISRRTDELLLPHEEIFPSQVALLRSLVIATRTTRILELGTYLGYSTAAFCLMLRDVGSTHRLVTVDADPDLSAEAQRLLAESGIAGEVEFRVGDAAACCQSLSAEGEEFDLVFLDVAEAAYVHVFDVAVGLLRRGGMLVVDNVLMKTADGWRSGENVVQSPTAGDSPALIALLHMAKEDERLASSVVSCGSGLLLCARL